MLGSRVVPRSEPSQPRVKQVTSMSTRTDRGTKRVHKTHQAHGRPPFETVALVLQGGGALGAYQAGAYQALAEAPLQPDCIPGISIPATHPALIPPNPPTEPVANLRTIWDLAPPCLYA